MLHLTCIKLILSRNPDAGFPEGDSGYGYLIVAPLNHDGLIDIDKWRENRARCTVIRFAPDAESRADGWLSHRNGKWRIHYDESDEGPDEAFDHLSNHRLWIGDYVTITSPIGRELVYQIVENRDAQAK
jgi:hypothetical protein